MANTQTAGLLKYLGLMGTSGVRTGSLVPRARTPDADQRLFAEFGEAGKVSDPDIWTKFNSVLKRPTTFDAQLQLWDEMGQWDMLAAAISEITEEATQSDASSPGTLWYQCNDAGFEDELNDMLARLDVEQIIQSQVWHVASLGNHFEKLEYAPKEGVMGMSFVHPMEMRRYWLERNRKCIGFRWLNHKPNKEDVFVTPDNTTPVERVSMTTGQHTEELYYPWDFCFTGDTKVSLLDGRELSFEQLQKEFGTGEFWVYSSTPEGRIVPGRAHSLKRTRQNADVVEVELDNGEKIKCTPDHRFLLRDGTYREASKLSTGDALMSRRSAAQTVASICPAGNADVYDFEVDDQHNFALSAGVFVHNCHFRRMFRMRISEHGEPVFAEADGIYKKLRMAIDQMVVCRAQVQPDRYAVSIDVQEQPPAEQFKTVQRWRQALRSKLAFGQVGDPNSLNSASDFSSYYNALALDTIIYLAQPKGFNNTITKLPGTADVPDVYDIELLTDLFYAIIGMPKAWFGGNSDGDKFPSGKALLAQDIRFLRKIKSIRRPLIHTYQWLAYFHAVLKGKNVEELDIKAMMSPIGSLEDQMKMEMLSMQSDVMAKLGDVMEQFNLPKEAWIEVVFKRYMHLPDEVVNVFLTALPGEVEQKGPQGESLNPPRRPTPSTVKLIAKIHEALSRTPDGMQNVRLLREIVYNERLFGPTAPQKRWTAQEVLLRPNMVENDVVISSYGRHPFGFKRPNQPVSEAKSASQYGGGIINAMLNGSAPTAWDDDGKTKLSESTKPVSDESQGSWDHYRPFISP